jgi:cardiolipin synthase
MKKRGKITIPDYISFSRFVASPIVLILIIKQFFIAAFIIYAIAVLTDLFDGLAARTLNQKTALGAMIDALADRVLCITVVLTLLFTGTIPLLIFSILVSFFIIEWIIGIWITIKYKKFYLYFAHRNSVRYTAVLIFIVIGGLVLNYEFFLSYTYLLLILTIPFVIYVIGDYVKYILTHKKWETF